MKEASDELLKENLLEELILKNESNSKECFEEFMEEASERSWKNLRRFLKEVIGSNIR